VIYVGKNSWTTKDDEMPRKLVSSGETLANIARILNRKPDSVRARAGRLKIRLAKARNVKL
jgi:hypothetical protein